jgi:hypothetical protein
MAGLGMFCVRVLLRCIHIAERQTETVWKMFAWTVSVRAMRPADA